MFACPVSGQIKVKLYGTTEQYPAMLYQVLQEIESEGFVCRELYCDTHAVNLSAAAEEVAVLKDAKDIIMVGATVPVGFFAYPGKPRLMAPPDCTIHTLATPGHDLFATLDALCQAVGASKATPAQLSDSALAGGFEDGAPNAGNIGRVLVGAMPEQAILVDEAVTSGRQLADTIPFAPAHDCIDITGGAIGFGLPAAVGAAIAAPDGSASLFGGVMPIP